LSFNTVSGHLILIMHHKQQLIKTCSLSVTWAMLDNDGSNFLEHGFQPPHLSLRISFPVTWVARDWW
jgi:hypothetical protein